MFIEVKDSIAGLKKATSQTERVSYQLLKEQAEGLCKCRASESAQSSIDFFADICGIFKSEYYMQQFLPQKQSFDSLQRVREKFCEVFEKEASFCQTSCHCCFPFFFFFSFFFPSGLNVQSIKSLVVLRDRYTFIHKT